MRDSTRPGTSVADGEEIRSAGQPLLSSPRSFRLISLRNSGSSSGARVRVGRAGRCGRATPGPDDESAPGVRAPIPRQAKAITRIVTAIATSMYIGHLLLCCSEYAHPGGGELSNMGDVGGDVAVDTPSSRGMELQAPRYRSVNCGAGALAGFAADLVQRSAPESPERA